MPIEKTAPLDECARGKAMKMIETTLPVDSGLRNSQPGFPAPKGHRLGVRSKAPEA